MAWVERYANFDLGTGANDGTSEANAWQTISAMTAGVSAGHRINIKRQSAGYDLTSNVTITNAGTATAPIWFRAYQTTPGDGGLWLVNYNSGSSASLTFSGSYVWVEGIDYQPGASVNIAVLSIYGTMSRAIRCRIRNRTGNAAYANPYGCDIELFSAGSHRIEFAGANLYPITVKNNRFKITGTTSTFSFYSDMFGRGATFVDNLFIGAGSADGLFIDRQDNGRNFVICNNRFYNFASAIIVDEEPNGGAEAITVFDNVFESCSSYAIERTNAEAGFVKLFRNKHYNTTSGFTNYSTEAEPIENESLSGSPFVDAAGGDFTLNSTAGAGAACRAAGFPINEPYDWDNMTDKAVHSGSGGSTEHSYISIG